MAEITPETSNSSKLSISDAVRTFRPRIQSQFDKAENVLKKSGVDENDSHFGRAKINIAAAMEREEMKQDIDPLTGLFNKTGFEKRMREEIARTKRLGYKTTIVMIDLNGLKTINDTDGHLAGDEYIKNMAECLGECSRATDVIGHPHGDEFLVLLPTTTVAKAEVWLKKLTASMEKKGVKASVGIADFNPNDPEGSLREADEMMYAIKRAYYEANGLEQRKT